MYCSNCGKEITYKSKFCKFCGFPTQNKTQNKEINKSLDELSIVEKEIDTNEKKNVSKSKKMINVTKNYNSIGGWLILFGVGLLFGILRSIAELNIYRTDDIANGFLAIFISGKGLEHIGRMDVAIVLTIIPIFFLILTFVHFVRRSNLTKGLFFFTSILNLSISIYLIFIFQKEANTEDLRTLMVLSISFVLWGSYFVMSERVKCTFVIEQTNKSNIIKLIISSILPIILFYQYYDFKSEIKNKAIIEVEKEQKELNQSISMNYYANLFTNESNFLKLMSDTKNNIIESEIASFKKNYDLKNKKIIGEGNIISYVDKTFTYPNLIKAILYYCGKQCSDINRNLNKSYSYFEKLNHKDINIFKSLMLSEMNFYGIGVIQNLDKAVDYASSIEPTNEYTNSIKNMYIGWGYLFGKKYEKDINKAISFLNKSENMSAIYISAILMATQNNLYTENDVIKQFNKATKLGNPSSEMMLGLYFIDNGKKDKGMKVLEECSKSNNNCKTFFEKLSKSNIR